MTRHFLVMMAALALSSCSDDQEMPPDFDPVRFHSLSPASEQTWAKSDKVVCTPTAMDVCTASVCESRKPAAFPVWHPKTGKYDRCDANGCDTYDADVTYSGAYANLTFGGRSVLFKISSDNRFIEIATLADSVLVYRGTCTAQ